MFYVKSRLENDGIVGELIVDSYFFDHSKYDYAFYLYRDGEKVNRGTYTKSMTISFPLKNMTGVFIIKTFIRDTEHGNKRSFYSEKISIDSQYCI